MQNSWLEIEMDRFPDKKRRMIISLRRYLIDYLGEYENQYFDELVDSMNRGYEPSLQEVRYIEKRLKIKVNYSELANELLASSKIKEMACV